MTMEGYITIPMTVLDSWVGHDSRYLKWWMDLRSEACRTAKTVWFHRQQVSLQPRQVLVTASLLVKQWQVSKPTVIRFLQRLEQENLIERQMDSRKTIITITPLGWAESEVKSVVNSAVNVAHEVDRQTYRQVPSSPIIDNYKNIIACGGTARTREVAEAINLGFEEIIAFFNEQMTGKTIPQVAIITQERCQAFAHLVQQTGVDTEQVKQAIMNAAASDFLNGKGPKGWVASFDWMMVPQNFQKVLENFYRNKQVTQPQYETANRYQDPRRGVEASRTASYAAGYDRPL